MKTLGAIALLLSLGLFTLGCEAKKDAGAGAGAAPAAGDTGGDAGSGDKAE